MRIGFGVDSKLTCFSINFSSSKRLFLLKVLSLPCKRVELRVAPVSRVSGWERKNGTLTK